MDYLTVTYFALTFGSTYLVMLLQESGGLWTPQVAPGGHFGPVLDLSWDPQGKYFVSVSSDQTVRLHARWVRENVEKVLSTHLFCISYSWSY